MKLSSQEEYGLRCLLRVGREGDGASLTIPELSRAEGISEPNVAKMMRVLRRGGFGGSPAEVAPQRSSRSLRTSASWRTSSSSSSTTAILSRN